MDCPICGKALQTEQGARQHHTKVHDEPLPNHECSGCGVEFYDPKARLEYCDDCDPNAGENNGNWQNAKETAECERCGDAFEYYPSDKKGVYCPGCVNEADEFLGTPYAEVHDIEPVTRECEQCGGEFEVLPCYIRCNSGRFCDEECFHSWLSENRSGEPIPYKGDWFSVRRRALKRDDHRCQNCNKHKREIGREPDVYHIKPVREFEDPQNAHKINSVITLCRSCHVKVEDGRIPLSEIRPGLGSRNE